MEEKIVLLLIDKLFIALIVVVVTWLLSRKLEEFKMNRNKIDLLELELKRSRNEILTVQKYKYFLPLKHWARELRGRIWHIKQRFLEEDKTINKDLVEEKRNNMIYRFKKDFASKTLDWFFIDSPKDGGYFISSTIYMHCILFYWIYKTELEYPYMQLKPEELSRTVGDCRKDENPKDLHFFIKKIKQQHSGENGIPYGIMDSIGEFVYDYSRNKLLNYEEFCKLLIDDQQRIKFIPMLKYWVNICDPQDLGRINKLFELYSVLKDFDKYEIDI
jgi:hypothetical protein